MMLACILMGGPDRSILVNGKVELFEDHPYFGPTPIRKDGGERKVGPRHAFWEAVTRWYATGKEVGPDGLCVWSPAPKERFVRVGRRRWIACHCADGKLCRWHQLNPGAEVCYV